MKETKNGLKEEAKVRTTPEINKLFLPGEFGAVLDWEVRDTKTGELVNKGIKKAESFTRQFLDLLLVKFLNSPGLSPIQIRDTGGNYQDICNGTVIFATDALAGDVTFGIVVGTGAVAPTISDYVLGALIAHGVGVGQLQYSIGTWGAPASDATTSQFTITRNFANASGAGITVNEIGLYVKAPSGAPWQASSGDNTIRYFMTIRDVIAGGILVGNGQTLTINYRPQCVI